MVCLNWSDFTLECRVQNKTKVVTVATAAVALSALILYYQNRWVAADYWYRAFPTEQLTDVRLQGNWIEGETRMCSSYGHSTELLCPSPTESLPFFGGINSPYIQDYRDKVKDLHKLTVRYQGRMDGRVGVLSVWLCKKRAGDERLTCTPVR